MEIKEYLAAGHFMRGSKWRQAAGLAALATVWFGNPAVADELSDIPRIEARRNDGWTWQRYRQAVGASDRKLDIDAATFAAVQERRPAMLNTLRRYLTERLGSDRKSTRLNSSHVSESRMPSSA